MTEPRGATVPGDGLAAAGAAQRRLVAVLFADLSGYTAFCQARDPEEVHLLVRPLMNALRRECESLGGLVPGIEGDGFMAVFGARAAAEDTPARAVDAAVRMQELLRDRQNVLPELPGLHVGIHMGEVIVAWEDERTPHLSGDVVNVASRLAGLAGAGTVLASEACVELSGRATGWSALLALSLRGREGTVEARELAWSDGVQEHHGERWTHDAPYVRRPVPEQELQVALGRGGAVVVGEPGIGKTRLVLEVLGSAPVLRVSCAGMVHPEAREVLARLLHGAGVDAGGHVDLLRNAPPGADGPALLRRVGEKVQELAPEAVVVVEDAELLPDQEVEDLGQAVAAGGSTWVLVSRRPLPVPLPVVDVPGLTELERGQLVDVLLPGASRELRDLLLRRAGDSPLFLEQCVRLLLESGAVRRGPAGPQLVAPALAAAVPTSMRLFVSSRLDLLDSASRHLIAVAAVLGEEPDLDLLRHLTGDDADAVERLVDRGLLRWGRDGARPVLRFHHALVRDVAYQTLLHADRAALHLAAAEWYAVLPVSHVLEAQAGHLEAAVALGGADCELLRRAVEAMVLFARSVEEERPRAAHEVLLRARTLVENRAECAVDRLALDLSFASVCLLAGREEEARGVTRRALHEAERRGDRRAEAEAHYHLGRAVLPVDAAAAEEHFARAERGFGAVDDPGGQARVAVSRVFFALHDEGVAPQLARLESAFALAQRSGDARLQASAAQQLAMHHGFSSGRAEFEEWSERARQVSRQDDATLGPRLDTARAALAFFELDPAKGLEAAQQALAAGRDLGLQHVYGNALIGLIDLSVIAGSLTRARALYPEARAYAATRGSPWYGLQLDLLEARLLQREGDVGSALQRLDEVASHDLAAATLLRRDLAEVRGWVALERGRFGEARASAAEAVLVDDATGDRCPTLRPRLIDVVAAVAAGETLSLGDIAALRTAARDTGLTTIAGLATRWLFVDELARGWTVDLYRLDEAQTLDARALDLELEALSTRNWERLLDAAGGWAELGTTVWQARALLWHSELTGTPHPEADELLEVLQSPAGLAEHFRSQVRGLRT